MSQRVKAEIRLFFILTLLTLLVTACGPKNAIIGGWEQAGGTGEVLEFYKDGTLTATSFGLTSTGRYEFIDDDTIRVEMPGVFGLTSSQVFDVTISGDTLTLSYSGISIAYTKVK